MRSQNVPLSASMVQEKAVIFVKELKTFRLQMAGCNAGRKEIIYHSRLFLGSRNLKVEITLEMVNAWSETSLPTLLSNYDLKDIYKADEYGLFYQCRPNKTYQL